MLCEQHIHNVEHVELNPIEEYHPDGRRYFTRTITIKCGEFAFDIELCADKPEHLQAIELGGKKGE